MRKESEEIKKKNHFFWEGSSSKTFSFCSFLLLINNPQNDNMNVRIYGWMTRIVLHRQRENEKQPATLKRFKLPVTVSPSISYFAYLLVTIGLCGVTFVACFFFFLLFFYVSLCVYMLISYLFAYLSLVCPSFTSKLSIFE